jgi:hypothetical protein
MRSNLPRQFDDATNRTVELIDVLWLQGNAIVAAFEVESTTSIYSGPLRMADLVAMQPNRPPDAPHLARRYRHNLRRLHPAQLPRDRLDDHLAPGHRPRLPLNLPLDSVHRAALPQGADIFKCL